MFEPHWDLKALGILLTLVSAGFFAENLGTLPSKLFLIRYLLYIGWFVLMYSLIIMAFKYSRRYTSNMGLRILSASLVYLIVGALFAEIRFEPYPNSWPFIIVGAGIGIFLGLLLALYPNHNHKGEQP